MMMDSGINGEKIAAMKAAAERNKALLLMRKEEFKSVETFLRELEAMRVGGKQRTNALVPMFGGAAMMPAQLVLDGRAAEPGAGIGEEKDFVLTWLGTDLFARTDVETAVKLLKVRLGDVEDAIDEVTRGMEAMTMMPDDSSAREPLDVLAEAQREKKESGVVDICEPISMQEAMDQIPRPTSKEKVEELEKMNKSASEISKKKEDSDMDAFFKAMEEQEAHWNEMCQVKESVGEDIDENEASELAYDVAARLWPKKKKIPEAIVPEKFRDQEQVIAQETEEKQPDMLSDSQPMKFEPIIREHSTKKVAVEDPCMSRTVIEHPDGADMVEDDDSDSEKDDDVDDVDEAMKPGDGEDSVDEDEENMIIKPKNPSTFIPHAMLHTRIPENALRCQREELEREDELRKKNRLPPVTSSTKFKTLPLSEADEETGVGEAPYQYDDESEDLICLASADGHPSPLPKVHTSKKR